jgi:F-type H+-transporting ATPase subunit epsilon
MATAAKDFALTVLSAERELYTGAVRSVTVPTEEGEITLLPHHAALVANLHAGELTLRTDSGEEQLFVGGGVLEMSPDNTCRILADVAERSAEIDEAAAAEARKRAETALAEAASEPEVAAAKAALLNAIMKLRIAEKRRRKH